MEFTDEKLKPKVQLEEGFIYIMRPYFNSVVDLQIDKSDTCMF